MRTPRQVGVTRMGGDAGGGSVERGVGRAR